MKMVKRWVNLAGYWKMVWNTWRLLHWKRVIMEASTACEVRGVQLYQGMLAIMVLPKGTNRIGLLGELAGCRGSAPGCCRLGKVLKAALVHVQQCRAIGVLAVCTRGVQQGAGSSP